MKGAASVIPNQSLSRSLGMMQTNQIFLFSIFICGNIHCRRFQNKYTSSWWECLKLCINFQDISTCPASLGLFSQQYLSRPLMHFSDVRFSSSLMEFFAGCGGNRQVTSQLLQASICSQAITARHMHSLSLHLLLRPPTLTPLLPHLL